MAKGKIIKVLSVLLAALVLAAGMPLSAGAARVFTDIGDGEWYDTFVLEAYEAGLITGRSDATFRPNELISKVEVIVCLARLAGYTEGLALDSYIQKYNYVLTQNKIPSWANGYIAFGLDKGIVTQEELATFIKSDGVTSNYAKRYEVAVYFARALGLKKEAESYINLVLDFADNEIISQWSRGYIKALADRNIISGDTQGKFNPNNEINRAAVATMLAKSIQFAGSIQAGTTGIEGRIEEIVSGTGRTVIKIAVTGGGMDMYDTASNVTVRLDGITASLSGIAAGQQGIFGIKDDKIVSIDVTSSVETVEGIARGVFDGGEYSSITIEDDDGDRSTYRVAPSTVIRLEGSAVSLAQISSGDRATITASGNYATRIEAEKKTKTVMGILAELKTDKNLVLVLKKGTQEIEYPVDDDADVERDGRNRGLEDLRKGDEIEITTEYGIVVKIEAESVDRDIEGTIYSLLIARPHQLTIMNEDGELETFLIPVDVDIELDGKTAGIYDLRLDYIIEAEVESDEIVSIEAESVVSQNDIMGTVEYVNTSVNVITLKVFDISVNANVTKQVNVNNDTRIIDADGDKRYLRHIDVGDRLMVVGHSELGVFIADTIVITNR